MSVFFLDTSAVVKRYVIEPGSEWVNHLLRPTGEDVFYVAWIAAPETVSALTRRMRRGELDSDEAESAIARFRREWRGLFRRVEITPALLINAMDLAHKHALRGYDAVQLSAAVQTNEMATSIYGSNAVFVSADSDLNVAASDTGFQTENPLDHVEDA